jgi:hypothetical protein
MTEPVRNLDPFLRYLLDHAPPGAIIPSLCEVVDTPSKVWLVATTEGEQWTHGRGGVWRSRVFPDGSSDLTFFEDGEPTWRRALRPKEDER